MSQDRENLAKEKLIEMLGDLFYIQEEVAGRWVIDDSPLRLDLLLRPNEKAKSMGFDVDAIGIEIKDPQSKESVKKFSVHDKFHRTLILSGFCLLKIAKISLNSSFFPKPIKR